MLHDALTRRDVATFGNFLARVTHPDDRERFFGVCRAIDDLQDWIGEWIAARPGDPLPLLMRGAHGVAWAWEARGGKKAKDTGRDQFREFFARLAMAEDCLDEVTELAPHETLAWNSLVTSARGRQVDRAEAERRFAGALRHHPANVTAHEEMLQYLCEKWHGSHEERFGFARSAAERLPGTLVPQIIAVAHIERWLSLPGGEDDEYITAHEVCAELRTAAQQSIWHPAYQRRPGWESRFNTFAFAFSMAEDYEAAAAVFDAIGDRATDWPWFYASGKDPFGRFRYWREQAYARRG